VLSKTDFGDQVMDAYGHLYDLVYLRTHSLTDVLVPDPSLSRKERAWRLHHILLDVIGELEPESQVSVLSRQWRRHRLMMLRYVKALDPNVVADQLTISRRHFYREHKIAVEAITDILWERFVVHPPQPQEASEFGDEEASPNRVELLRLEVARMAQANRYARVSDVVQGVLVLLQEMLHQHELDVQLAFPESLPGVSVNRNLLRQVLLGIMDCLTEGARHALIALSARVEGSVVCLSARTQPRAGFGPGPEKGGEEQLATLEQMAKLSSVEIVPEWTGPALSGFTIRLPIADRTVLVIDDNEDVLELFRRYLAAHHYRVSTSPSAQGALDLARQLQPYAITLDLMMPDQDGWDLLQTLLNHADTQHIPIIVCTVLKQRALALSLGAAAFLDKPVTEQELLAALRALEET
jgi:CheY-like chemotaxis protein